MAPSPLRRTARMLATAAICLLATSGSAQAVDFGGADCRLPFSEFGLSFAGTTTTSGAAVSGYGFSGRGTASAIDLLWAGGAKRPIRFGDLIGGAAGIGPDTCAACSGGKLWTMGRLDLGLQAALMLPSEPDWELGLKYFYRFEYDRTRDGFGRGDDLYLGKLALRWKGFVAELGLDATMPGAPSSTTQYFGLAARYLIALDGLQTHVGFDFEHLGRQAPPLFTSNSYHLVLGGAL